MTVSAKAELDSVKEAGKKLIAKLGLTGDFELELLRGGKNNRVFRARGNRYDAILKSYFRHPDDPRDRCTTEFSFLSFAWRQGLRCIPEPLHHEPRLGLAVYQFVPGRHLTNEDVGEPAVRDAASFFLALNSHATAARSANLNAASEACFSVSAHLQCTQRRVDRLVAAAVSDSMEPEARSFIVDSMLPAWNAVHDGVQKECVTRNINAEALISVERKRLSPSDFGFHNAIKRPDGSLCFIDFEYAGWDDIAKTLCDFYLQPVFPVPQALFRGFQDRVLQNFPEPALEVSRMNLLMPVHQVKWCCIMLNDFLPTSQSRRQFSLGAEQDELRKSRQLELAKTALHRIEAFAYKGATTITSEAATR